MLADLANLHGFPGHRRPSRGAFGRRLLQMQPILEVGVSPGVALLPHRGTPAPTSSSCFQEDVSYPKNKENKVLLFFFFLSLAATRPEGEVPSSSP